MKREQTQRFCRNCGESSLFARDRYEPPHLGHLLLTLVTCGLWLPVWIVHMMANVRSSEPFRCQRCGCK